MSQRIVETIYGSHRIYQVIADRGFFGSRYYVRSTDGRVFAAFAQLDEAVRWAQHKAAN